jgi:tetratricopeptide (TPR) repeat protein
VQKHKPHAKLDEGTVDSWAEELIDTGCLSEAIVLLSLNVRTYPDSSNAESSLARARLLSGERQAAIEGYRRALQKNRVNPEARRRLRELDSETER